MTPKEIESALMALAHDPKTHTLALELVAGVLLATRSEITPTVLHLTAGETGRPCRVEIYPGHLAVMRTAQAAAEVKRAGEVRGLAEALKAQGMVVLTDGLDN